LIFKDWLRSKCSPESKGGSFLTNKVGGLHEWSR